MIFVYSYRYLFIFVDCCSYLLRFISTYRYESTLFHMWLCVDACIRGITVHVGGVGVKVTRPSTLESRWAAPRVHIAPVAVRPEYLLYTSAHWARGGVKQYWGGRRSDVVPKRDQAPTNDLKNAPKTFPKRSRPRP